MIDEHWLVDAVGQAIAGLERRGLAIDVGANTGNWTSELCGVFESVVAFEPDPRARDQIASAANVKVVDAVVGRDCGRAVLHLGQDPGQNSLLAVHPIGGHGQSPVVPVGRLETRCVTLDSEAESGADLVKIDVEGAEPDVLAGCRDAARWVRTAFVVECHDNKSAVAEELWRLGKTVALIRHPSATAHPGHCWLIGVRQPEVGRLPQVIYPIISPSS